VLLGYALILFIVLWCLVLTSCFLDHYCSLLCFYFYSLFFFFFAHALFSLFSWLRRVFVFILTIKTMLLRSFNSGCSC